MTFWTDTNLEPKRQYRWVAIIGNMPSGASYYIKTVKKPVVEIKPTEHKYLNHTFKYPGSVKWSPVEMTLVDPVSPDASQNLAAMLENSGYIIPSKPSHVTTVSKAGMAKSIGKVQIIQISDASPAPNNNTGIDSGNTSESRAGAVGELGSDIEIWTLNNPIITKIDFGGELDYSKEELVSIGLTFEYDWADLTTRMGHELPSSVTNVLTALQINNNSRFKPRSDT